MTPKFAATVGSVVVSGGLVAAAAALAAPAQADTTDAFLGALANAGLSDIDPGNAAQLGQQVCPMLADSGQNVADVAAKVADAGGMKVGVAHMFTGLAISIYCPGAIAKISDPAAISDFVNGQTPLLSSILGR